MNPSIQIDGSIGEGGGQILRTALSLSIITGKSFVIHHIRENRKVPGLRSQHLTAVNIASKISNADTRGAYQNSTSLTFVPKTISSGTYDIDIGTAGSTSLVLQTILIPLNMANSASSVAVTGGTHVPWSPSFDYLDYIWSPVMKEIGFDIILSLERSGFYPQGGGKIKSVIQPNNNFKPINKIHKGKLLTITGISSVANLDLRIAIRQKLRVLELLDETDLGINNTNINIKSTRLPSRFRGTSLFLKAEYENGLGGFSSLGEKGKPAEIVAEEAVNSLVDFCRGGGALDKYMADQLLLPLSLIKCGSRFSTNQLSNHFLTNREIILKFLPVKIESFMQNDKNICISVEPDS